MGYGAGSDVIIEHDWLVAWVAPATVRMPHIVTCKTLTANVFERAPDFCDPAGKRF